MALVKIHEYQVHMTGEGCTGEIQEVLNLHKDEGIKDVDISLTEQKVKVTTSLSAEAVLEMIKTTGKDVVYINSK